MRTEHVLWTALLLLVAAPAASAQLRVTALGPGTPVRVSPVVADPSRGWIRGHVLFADADSLVIRRHDRAEAATFRRDEIGALQVAILRSRGSDAVRYGLLTAAVAGGAGAGLTALTYDADEARGDFWPLSRGESALLTGVLVGLPAAFLGAVVGATIPNERWTPTALPVAPTVTVRPDGAVGVTLSLTP